MLGWALKKGFQGATGLRDAPQGGGDDTTQLDAPDTPAPVFAARAIKNAIWGQPAADTPSPVKSNPNPNKTERVEPAPDVAATRKSVPVDTRSPTKLNSILLTPGTATSRRKRVSFGRDVKAGNSIDASPLAASSARNGRLRKRTSLQQALENARPAGSKASVPLEEKPEETPEEDDTEEESEWEDEDICCSHDVTVDLNEPHSESGKYWKAEWSRYREEAKSDIELLVKYKANARSFAAKKDMEANQLSQKLKEEQSKVIEMEKAVADMTAKLAATKKHGTDKDNADMTKDLASQTALASQYRERVKDLEARLKDASGGSSLDRSSRQRINTSPRTEQSILDVSRELRKARSDLRQLDRLRDEAKRLKSNLAISREQVAKLEARVSAGGATESSRVGKLEKQLQEVKEVSRQKDTDIRNLKRDYETLKREAKSRMAEAIQVLEEKNAKIDELEKKLGEVEAINALHQQRELDAAIARHNRTTRDLGSGIESVDKPWRDEKARPIGRRARAASIDDITLDMMGRSLLGSRDDRVTNAIQREKAYGSDFLTDWTADIPTFELEVKDRTTRRDEAAKPDQFPAKGDTGASPSRRADQVVRQRPLDGTQRVTSNILSNRVNGSSGRQSRRYQSDTEDAPTTDRNQDGTSRRTAKTQTASRTEDRSTMHGALDPPTRGSRVSTRSNRPASPDIEAPAIDLVRDQFSRLGGPSAADRSAVGNTSRCTLPADRQAAARARIERKRKGGRKTSEQGLDKENVKPRVL